MQAPVMPRIRSFMPQEITVSTCLVKCTIAFFGFFTNGKCQCTIRIFFLDFLNQMHYLFIGKKRIFSPLKNKCPKPEFISFGTACHDVFFCQTISLCLPVTSPDATVKTIIFAVVCKLDQSTYINFISIHLLPYLICKISRILLIFL